MALSAPLHVINLITNFPPHLDNKKINLIWLFPCFLIRAAVHAQWGESFYKIFCLLFADTSFCYRLICQLGIDNIFLPRGL